MSNNLQGSTTYSQSTFKEVWARLMQRKNLKIANYPAIISMEADDAIDFGWAYHKPYRSKLSVNVYTPGSNVTIQTLNDTDDQLFINQMYEASFYVDDFDQLRSNFKFIDQYAEDASTALSNFLDGQVNYTGYAGAVSKIDDGTMGGTSGNAVVATTSNIQSIFSAAKARLGRYNAAVGVNIGKNSEKLFCMASPDFIQVLVNYLAGKNSNLGDKTGMNGHQGSYYGFDIYESNNLTWTAVLSIPNTPNANDTVVLKTVDENANTITITFTFVSSIGSTAGNILINGSAANACTNLTQALNQMGSGGTTGSGTNWVAFASGSDQLIALTGISAVAASTSVTVTAPGASFFVVTTPVATASESWTATSETQHVLFGVKGAINLAIKRKPRMAINQDPLKFGKNVLNGILYGLHVFQNDKARLIDCQVATSAYTL